MRNRRSWKFQDPSRHPPGRHDQPAVPAPTHSGFTLVELLVSLALTIFILSLFTTLFVQATGGMTRMKGIMAVDQRVRTAATLLRKDLKDVILIDAGGNERTPATIFDPRDRSHQTRVAQGYFLLEENSPPIRQGVDQWGMPVEVDTDDVLAFTTRRLGSSPSEMFYGRVPQDGALDNYPGPKARHDTFNNGLFSSNTAEVVYFLRPDRQYRSQEIRGHDVGETNSVTNDPTVTTPTLTSPPTYTLYRRQLLILPDNVASFANSAQFPAVEKTFGNQPNNYNYANYDVAAKPDPSSNGQARFVTLADISQRRYRYGINHDENNDFPFSWSTTSGGSYQSATIFDYGTSDPITDPPRQWLGRPISLESNIPIDAAGNPATNNIFMRLRTLFGKANVDGNVNGIADGGRDDNVPVAGTPAEFGSDTGLDVTFRNNGSIGYRYGDDVLLQNVLSFDVKVLDDDPRVEPTQANGGLPTTGAYGSPSQDFPASGMAHIDSAPTISVNPLRSTGVTADQRAEEFVDLGYRGTTDVFNVAGNPPNADGAYGMASLPPRGDPNAMPPTAPPPPYPAPFKEFYSYAYGQDPQGQGFAYGFPARWRHIGRNAAGGTPAPYVPLRTYDTWSTAYNINPSDTSRPLRPIPYAKPLRAIQIKIRVLDPASQVVRETTIVHRFGE